MNVTVLGTNLWHFRRAVDKTGKAALIRSDVQTAVQIGRTLSFKILAERGSLINLLRQTSDLESSRFHDRLYAVMHLADDFYENDIEVDYNKTASQIMLDAIDHHIRRHRNLRFLNYSFRSDFDEIGYAERNSECSFPTWIPRRWLGSSQCGQAIWSSERSLGHAITVGEQLDDDEDSSGKILSDGKYAPSKNSVKFLTKFLGQVLFTSCTPDAVDMTHMRLRIRGMKVGEVQTVLSLPPDETGDDDWDGMTVAQFWSSSLGQHIGSYFCNEERQIPLGMVRALSHPWLNEYFSYEDAVFGFKRFYDCSTKPDLADQHVGEGGHLIDALLAPQGDRIVRGSAFSAITHIVAQLWGRKGILTDKDQFGLVSECNIRAGDEIWILLGRSIPSVLRKQSNGTYEYICTARIPVLMDGIIGHTDIRRFSTKAAPGEQIGEWTIEDIELV